MSSILLLLALFLLIFEAFPSSSASIGSRSILRAVVTNNGDQPDFAVELNATNFDAVLKDTPATYAIVEFFANWCPACRNYKPHYEKVARLFNGPEAVHPGIILMTRVDCALKGFSGIFAVGGVMLFYIASVVLKFSYLLCILPFFNMYGLVITLSSLQLLAAQINNELCDKFSVGHYPMLLWAPPNKFVAGGWKPNQDKSEICAIDDGRTADRLLNWINKQMGRHLAEIDWVVLVSCVQLLLIDFKGMPSSTSFDNLMLYSSFGLDDEKYENELLQSNVSDPGQIARAVYDVEEATSSAFDIILDHKMIKSETRASLIKFLQLLVAHHPSRRCRKGSAEFLVNFDELYPLDILSANKQESINVTGKGALENFQICGKEVPRGYWVVVASVGWRWKWRCWEAGAGAAAGAAVAVVMRDCSGGGCEAVEVVAAMMAMVVVAVGVVEVMVVAVMWWH
ncbi:hypothetical protein TEA_029389 [Camellia sinensis var. sinensis]|uniref:Thioredoxin domain-containing protein n=1 Tax=Camellia sinensis var. sinensis TaxID=542762 RepID=A0A4S4D2D2_CAMSN|nr:hypothetical protein TEA_029389 [Camellia sinensis var. sinensis]